MKEVPKHIFKTAAAGLLALLLSGCAATPQAGFCAAGKPMVETQLYFGMNSKAGPVTPGDWQRFVRHDLAPRMPEGFTVTNGQGFWRGVKTGVTEAENSKVVIQLHEGSPAEEAALAAIIESYKNDFAQESVLRVDIPVCAAF